MCFTLVIEGFGLNEEGSHIEVNAKTRVSDASTATYLRLHRNQVQFPFASVSTSFDHSRWLNLFKHAFSGTLVNLYQYYVVLAQSYQPHDNTPHKHIMARLTALPEELVSNIAQRLGSDDLFSLRLSCKTLSEKSFHDFATEYFSEKCVMFTSESLGVYVCRRVESCVIYQQADLSLSASSVFPSTESSGSTFTRSSSLLHCFLSRRSLSATATSRLYARAKHISSSSVINRSLKAAPRTAECSSALYHGSRLCEQSAW